MNSGNSDIALFFFMGTTGMLLLAGALLYFFVMYQKRILRKELELNRVKSEKQEEILLNTVLAQEKERRRIAEDLHDEVGSMLSVIKLSVGRIDKKSAEEEVKLLASETKSNIDEIISQVRRISRALLPPSLEQLGLVNAIDELTSQIGKTGKVDIKFRYSGEAFRMDSGKELAVFRIIQELMNNALKHSEASVLYIGLKFWRTFLVVIVSDNGKGFTMNEQLSSGLGLKNLESRTRVLGARFKMKSVPGKGTLAVICVNSEM